MEKETEIEALARMGADGFSAIDKRMDRIEEIVIQTNRAIDRVIIPTLNEYSTRSKDLELQSS